MGCDKSPRSIAKKLRKLQKQLERYERGGSSSSTRRSRTSQSSRMSSRVRQASTSRSVSPGLMDNLPESQDISEDLNTEDSPDTKIIEGLSDGGRLLCGVHYTQSTSRRTLIGAALKFDKKLQDTMIMAPIQTLLFGEGLGDRISQYKSLQRSAAELRPKSVAPTAGSSGNKESKRNNLNFRGPPR
ncbi:hypothetical protein ABEB36_013959 [Hypothenemus hampei]|uniref:Uncharacterized protein n=1 Tax=Hypothenemus hampei TaxID=57062 RepID=A0ABD1E334_HYPHA